MKGLTSWFYGGIPDFPFTIGDEVQEFRNLSEPTPIWVWHDGVNDETKEEVTIQVFDKKLDQGHRLEAAQNYLSHLKKIRHPNVVKYIKSAETTDKILIAIEKCKPLGASIEELGDYQKLAPGFCALGLYHMLQAVDFLHQTMKCVHLNIHSTSVLVNQAGDWKLAGFELLHPHDAPPVFLKYNIDLLPGRYRPTEIENSLSQLSSVIKNSPISAVDAWCVGCLMFEVFQKGRFEDPREVNNIESIPESLRPVYKQLLRTNPESRATPGNILKKCKYFRHPIVLTMNFLDNIALKNVEEKEKFFLSLNKKLNKFPVERCKYKILPALLHALQFGSSNNANVLASCLKIGTMMTQDENAKHIIPVVVKLFENKSRSTRINLLNKLELFIPFLSEKLVNDQIFPLVVSGFSDNVPTLRERTIRSLVLFAPKLSEKNMTDKAIPCLQRLQKGDKERAIRTNSIIVFGKISEYIPEKSRSQTLIPVFLSGLKDPFLAARCAALAGLSTALHYFSAPDIGTRILPFCCKYLLDPFVLVRDAASRVVESSLKILKEHAKMMPKEPPNAGKIAGTKKSKDKVGVSVVDRALSAMGRWTGGAEVDDENDLKARMGELKAKPVGDSTQKSLPQSNVSSSPSMRKAKELPDSDSDWSESSSESLRPIVLKKITERASSGKIKTYNSSPDTQQKTLKKKAESVWSDDEDFLNTKSNSSPKGKPKASEPEVACWDDFNFADKKPIRRKVKSAECRNMSKPRDRFSSPKASSFGNFDGNSNFTSQPFTTKLPDSSMDGLDAIFSEILNKKKKRTY